MSDFDTEILIKYIKSFSQQEIMVIGDLIADKFIIGDPERLSREAPVLILRQKNEKILPGGGANAASNISSLGGGVNLIGVIGSDLIGKALKKELQNRNIKTDGVLQDKKRPTAEKTRILAGGDQVVRQQVVRIDHLVTDPISGKLSEKIYRYVENNINSVNGILFSDYGNGLFSSELTQRLINLGEQNQVMTAVDSRYNLSGFKGASIATPNLEEASAACGKVLKSQAEVEGAGLKLRDKLELKYLLITQGGEGMTLFSPGDEIFHIPAANFTEVFDVTGAGDTVVGTLILALASGAEVKEAVNIANTAAGIVVRKSGVAVVTPEELIKEVVKGVS
ncbi:MULTISPECIES: bifunctional heptose 7-phosphate kinase/heptose 1-phosphate adenyltransferase [unclassified Halanaerobium]|jgi:rfaE bifunctional protein kinase chain/domain|uniref:bifunctional heptose 7-phosphate kinase/heptose 1-phosphate adenyltransferase n=1 Tax=unclassified Halanaerobium TaxID=2641197 RepID=UPI000DF45596|nr:MULTISPECIES: PfkB family carbohydrate kinase [unclassified Halanaerobium]RCW43818.1 rfaE bifunctional protein kinase chain/domain [Halanaerobium sp. MA284_MarDTE_T2]RCW80519.1 rfaE bifunctional protein kinase chain/domain [Halanaerobium sp. DL-01]